MLDVTSFFFAFYIVDSNPIENLNQNNNSSTNAVNRQTTMYLYIYAQLEIDSKYVIMVVIDLFIYIREYIDICKIVKDI